MTARRGPAGPRKPVLAIVGATGAVGTVMLDVVSTRDDVWGEIRLIASARSAGKRLRVRGQEVEVAALAPEVFDGVDLAMFDVPDEVSAQWAPVAAARGVVVIDKSGAFRMDPEVPLVVPEVNPEQAAARPKGIISVPNCTTLALIVALAALHRAFGLREMTAASYQAASGAGQAGTDTLYAQLEKVAGNRALGQRAGDLRGVVGDFGPFPAPLALNVVPWAGSLKDGGLVIGGAEDPQRDAQDPRDARAQGVGHVRAGAGHHRALDRGARRLRPHGDQERRAAGAERGAGRGARRRPGARRVPDPGRRRRHRPDLGGPGAAEPG